MPEALSKKRNVRVLVVWYVAKPHYLRVVHTLNKNINFFGINFLAFVQRGALKALLGRLVVDEASLPMQVLNLGFVV